MILDEKGEEIRRPCLMCNVHEFHDQCQAHPEDCG